MTALLLSLGASLAWGVSDFGGGTAARRYSTVTVLLFMRVGGVLAMGALALVTTAPWVGAHWPFAVAAVATTIGGGLAMLRALAIGPMGIAAPIIAASGAVPAIFGLATGSAPSAVVLAGLAVAAAGAVLASRAPGHRGERVDPAGVGFALLAALLIGSSLLLMHEASAQSAISAVLLERSLEALCLVLFVLLRPSRLAPTDAAGRLPLLAIGALESCAIVSFAAASTLGSLTIAAVLSSLYPVVTVLLARALHDERLSRAQLTGALLTLAGVVAVVATSA